MCWKIDQYFLTTIFHLHYHLIKLFHLVSTLLEFKILNFLKISEKVNLLYLKKSYQNFTKKFKLNFFNFQFHLKYHIINALLFYWIFHYKYVFKKMNCVFIFKILIPLLLNEEQSQLRLFQFCQIKGLFIKIIFITLLF